MQTLGKTEWQRPGLFLKGSADKSGRPDLGTFQDKTFQTQVIVAENNFLKGHVSSV